jgi:alcohol dehydrogenase class IV
MLPPIDRPFTQPATLRLPPITFGAGTAGQVVEEVRRVSASRVLVVTDPGVAACGVAGRVRDLLEASGITTGLYDRVPAEPSVASVEVAFDAWRTGNFDAVVGVGGGSSLDTAKGISIRTANDGPVSRYFGVEQLPKRGVPYVLLPTTAGTGSEVTPSAIFDDTDRQLKAGIVSSRLMAAAAIVDPDLTISCPPHVTAAAGLDALTHALEAYVAVRANPISDLYALEAVRLVGQHLRGAVARGTDRAARAGQLLASLYGGVTIVAAGTGLCHAMAYPLGSAYHVPHGVANALLLPAVMAYNLPADLAKFARLAEALGESVAGLSLRAAADRSVEAVRQLSMDIGLPGGLRAVGVPESALEGFVPGALSAARLITNNPRVPTPDGVLYAYRESW